MKGKVLTIFKEYLILTIASFIFAAAWECFMIPNGMSAGGMMGLCTIIQYATADLIPAQVSYIAINAVLMVVAVVVGTIHMFGIMTKEASKPLPQHYWDNDGNMHATPGARNAANKKIADRKAQN